MAPNDLPHLLKLLDDDSPVVRTAVARALSHYGGTLEQALSALPQPPGPNELQCIRTLLWEYRAAWLLEVWPQWRKQRTEPERLESAFSMLADFQRGYPEPGRLSGQLDDLALACRHRGLHRDAFRLAHFLFEVENFHGTQREYYDPRNSNLESVIEHRHGIPISLVCLYLLVGDRLGVPISGCAFPGHFLARVESDGRIFLVDCYNGGSVLSEDAVVGMNPETYRATRELIHHPADTMTILRRVLANLEHAYERAGEPRLAGLMAEVGRRTG